MKKHRFKLERNALTLDISLYLDDELIKVYDTEWQENRLPGAHIWWIENDMKEVLKSRGLDVKDVELVLIT